MSSGKGKKSEDKSEASKTSGVQFLKEILIIIAIAAVVGMILFAVSGTWPAFVAVKSGSMEPNIPTYSIVFVVDEDRYGGFMTQEESIASQSDMIFNGYGDVIVYNPNGDKSATPIIHRAIGYITDEEAYLLGYNHGGYITKGDNTNSNPVIDQAWYKNKPIISSPVRKDWIVGKAVFSVPVIGWIFLKDRVFWCILIVLVLYIAYAAVSSLIKNNKNKNNTNKAEQKSAAESGNKNKNKNSDRIKNQNKVKK
ncbi:MAG TPA: S26 family signal peptidase [Methanocorpusculum sp.]|nr:S26 family signal peptidase [Methanocorpusculum sp.]